jgi:hypothetical protein
MDRDLDASYDPQHFRKWMGGDHGPTSQGFRHMYFAGWKPISHPIRTFQIPLHAIGVAPARELAMANEARELIRAGHWIWGLRVLSWAIHYTQDLAQPFHSVQVVSWRMVPWHVLLSLSPSEAFKNLVHEGTRVITNYHWAYEGYVYYRLTGPSPSPFAQCLSEAETYSTIMQSSELTDPEKAPYAVAKASVNLASEVGFGSIALFGENLKNSGVFIPDQLELLKVEDWAARPDLTEQRQYLHKYTCEALANAAIASRRLIEWALQP